MSHNDSGDARDWEPFSVRRGVHRVRRGHHRTATVLRSTIRFGTPELFEQNTQQFTGLLLGGPSGSEFDSGA